MPACPSGRGGYLSGRDKVVYVHRTEEGGAHELARDVHTDSSRGGCCLLVGARVWVCVCGLKEENNNAHRATVQDRTRQDKTRQDRTGQDRTGQDGLHAQ
jgi:hypothetical protein